MSKCKSPVRITKNLDRQVYPDGLEVPCGKCLYCRSQKRREWALRLTHELSYWPQSSFLTLTYSDSFLPIGPYAWPTLRKDDLQRFFKRLRKRITPVRYFACGEYGDNTQRPHYHLIMYGLGLEDEHKQIVMDSWPLCDWDNPSIREGSFGLVEQKSIQYVAKYINKLLTGDSAYEMYEALGREPLFRLVSQGLGARYADNNAQQIQQQQHITSNGVPHSIPRYYINRLNLDLNQLHDRAKEIECDLVEDITGLHITRDELYKDVQDTATILKVEEHISTSAAQHNLNMQAKINLTKSKL